MALIQQLEDVLKDARPYNPENIGKIEEIRENMLQSGFNAPFKGIMQRSMDEARDLGEAEWADLKKQISYFRQVANLKKYSLARASVALSAHKLSDNFLRMGYSDIVEHGPLDGNHIRLLMETGNEGILAYRTLMDRFEMMSDSSNCFSVKVEYKGEKHTITIEDKERIDFKVARMFGIEAQVLDVKSSVKRRPIITSKGTRVSLVSSIVSYVSLDVERKLAANEKGKLKEYNDFLRGKGLRPDVLVDRVEGYLELKEEMRKLKLLGRENGKYVLDGAIASEIMRRRKERGGEILKRSTMLLLVPMFRFYLSSPKEKRRKENLYPGMVVSPTNSQIRIFTFLYELDEELPASAILRKKMEIEEKGARVDHMKLAAGLLLSETKKGEKWVADFLKMDVSEVRKSAIMFKSMEKDGRGGEFLKRIKDKKP
jgi:hypothetical protein